MCIRDRHNILLYLQIQFFIASLQIVIQLSLQFPVLSARQKGILIHQHFDLLGNRLQNIGICKNIGQPEFQIAALAYAE